MCEPTPKDVVLKYWQAQEAYFSLLTKIRNEELHELRSYHRSVIERNNHGTSLDRS